MSYIIKWTHATTPVMGLCMESLNGEHYSWCSSSTALHQFPTEKAAEDFRTLHQLNGPGYSVVPFPKPLKKIPDKLKFKFS